MNILILHNNNIPIELLKAFNYGGNSYCSEQLKYSSENNNTFDAFLCSRLSEIFQKTYDIIVIPYTLGEENYTGFSGLRVAAHIRLTKEWNHFTTPILFLGNDNIEDVMRFSDLGGILTTYRIYSSAARTQEELNSKISHIDGSVNEMSYAEWLTDSRFQYFLTHVNIKAPTNYATHHSVANEWAIYRWAKTIEADDTDIEKIISTVETNLYFKYLNAVHPVLTQGHLKKNNLTISYKENSSPKVLLVDDEAEKGWYEIFCTIINDINGFYFRHMDDEIKEKTPDEIVNIVHDKIINEDIDIVILDYRLHESDSFAKKIKDITGYKVLNDIKTNINYGTQVIVLSATNKIWNWEALQKEGADAFIMKDNPENSFEESTTANSILNFIEAMGKCTDRLFLKQFYENYKRLKEDFLPRIKTVQKRLPKEFVLETMKWFKLSCDILKSGMTEETKASSFLFLFSVLENISNRLIDIDNPIKENEEKNKYMFRGKNIYLKYFNNNLENTQNPLLVKGNNIPWTQKVLNALDYISVNGLNASIIDLVNKRNDFIHANATTSNKIIITEDDIITLHNIVFNGLIKC